MSESNLKEKAAKGLLWSGIGNLATQVVNMLFGIFIARILLPEDYGIVGLLLVFTGIASTLQESGLTAALINKKDCRHEDYNAVFWFSLFASLILYTILFFSTPLIAGFYHVPELKALGRISFLGFVFASIGIVPYAILLKSIQSGKMALVYFTATVLSGIAGVIMALCGMAYWGLAIQSVGMFLIRSILVWIVSGWKPSGQISFRPILPLWKFGVKILLTRIFEVITNNILIIFLGRFFTKTEVGYYNQASKWNYMAYSSLLFMANSTAQPIFVQADDEAGRSRRVLRKMTRFMAFLSFPCMFGLALIAPEFITILLTGKWEKAIPLLRILCIGGAFLPLSGIFSNFMLSRGKSRTTLASTVCLSIAQLSAAFLFRRTGILAMTAAYTTVSILWIMVWQLLAWREIRLRLRDTVRDVAPFALIAAAVMLAVHFITLPLDGIYLRILAKIACAVLLYGLAMRASDSHIYKEFLEYAKGGIKKILSRKR